MSHVLGIQVLGLSVPDSTTYEPPQFHPLQRDFASRGSNFLEQFDMDKDSDDVIVEFKNSRVVDHSAIEAIDTLAERYLSRGKTMHLRHLSSECTELLTKAGSLVEINVIEDPDYHIVSDKLA